MIMMIPANDRNCAEITADQINMYCKCTATVVQLGKQWYVSISK